MSYQKFFITILVKKENIENNENNEKAFSPDEQNKSLSTLEIKCK